MAHKEISIIMLMGAWAFLEMVGNACIPPDLRQSIPTISHVKKGNKLLQLFDYGGTTVSFLFGQERAELKARMECIIEAEEKTVKTIKKHIIVLEEQKTTLDKLITAIDENRVVMEKLLDHS